MNLWSQVYEFAGATGRNVEDIKRMSLWEFRAVRQGWRKANTDPDEQPTTAPTEEEFFAWTKGK